MLIRAIIFNLLLSWAAFCQGTYVGRYDAYAGFGYLDSPHIDLAERGFHMQVGIRLKTWYSAGLRIPGHVDNDSGVM